MTIMKESQFIHLHCHSHYSLLDGLAKIDELVEKAKTHNMTALALTDHGNLYGAIEFYKTCKKNNIKPIVGVELYVSPRRLTDKQAGIDGKNAHVTLLAKNLTGYKNLIRLVSIAQLEGFYYKPRVDHETLKKFSEGIICLSGCMKGELSQALTTQNKERAKEIIKIYQDIFGENYFLEIMFHPAVPNSETVRKEIINLGKELGIMVVATQDAHYIAPEDKKVHEVLLNIQTTGDKKFTFADDDFSFIDEATALKNFADFRDAVTNTKKVADLCNLELELGKWVFPDIEIPAGSNYDAELKKLAYDGLEKRSLPKTPEILERLDYELEIIAKKGYSPYFLVVSDILRFARENKILATTRGSAAGSLVSYLTFITTLNPLDFNLPFERFLNPERPSPPDIDMDFADDRRDEVIEYVKRKYGEAKVAQIGTFGKMMARGSVRDVARALSYPYSVGDRIAKLIPFGMQGFPMTIERAFEVVPELKKIYDTNQEAHEILDTAIKLEGTVRHVSVHAAGVVIAPKPLVEYVPVQYDPKGTGNIITQYDMYTVGEDGVGLTKLDFLGIRNLSILENAVSLVLEHLGLEIDIEKIPFNDEKTFEMLARGETEGVFQLNGSGMTKHLMELKPSTIHDINAMIALYRPGPMNNIPEYIARKQGQRKVTYFHPKVAKFLEKSYGILVYQDDLLFTAIELAGYNWESVDKFRKAVGKKIPAEMAKQHEIFVKGCEVHSAMTKEEAEDIWKLFEPFQGYGFNKAHAASYGRVAYQTAYMKAHYPGEYMCAILTAESGDTEKIGQIITECKRIDIPVLPPSINSSNKDFTLIKKDGNSKGDQIRFGLLSVKNVGEGIVEAIISERKKNGSYKSFADFLERVKSKDLNKKSLESLAKAGALDEFAERNEILKNMERILEFTKSYHQGKAGNQTSLFGMMTDKTSLPQLRLEKAESAKLEEKLQWEHELLGLYISGHPLEKYQNGNNKNKNAITIQSFKAKRGGTYGPNAIITALILNSRRIITKKGEAMLFLKLQDMTDEIECVVFPRTLQQFGEHIIDRNCVLISGQYSFRNDSPSIIAEEIRKI